MERLYRAVFTSFIPDDLDRIAGVATQQRLTKAEWMRRTVIAAIANEEGFAAKTNPTPPLSEHNRQSIRVGLLPNDVFRLDDIAIRRDTSRSAWVRNAILAAVAAQINTEELCVCGMSAGQHNHDGCVETRCWKYRPQTGPTGQG